MLVCAGGFGVGGLELVGRGWCYVGPRFRLCWPIVGAMLAHLGAMLVVARACRYGMSEVG